MSGRFVLIASYPKSGNTWTRIVLEQLRRGVGRPFSINDLDARYLGILRRFAFDGALPVNAADLLPAEIDALLPALYRRLASDVQEMVFLKVHDTAKRNRTGEWLYPPEIAGRVIYLVRHPFDVAVSTAHHLGISLERAVATMAGDGRRRAPYDNLSESLPQVFGSWSGNIESWIDNDSYDVSWARYEDLCAEPVGHFRRFADAAGLRVTNDEVSAAVEASRFERLQYEEKRAGFRERPQSSPKFFREGRSGTWHGVLDESLREQLVRDHGGVMERLGYGADGSVSSTGTAQ